MIILTDQAGWCQVDGNNTRPARRNIRPAGPVNLMNIITMTCAAGLLGLALNPVPARAADPTNAPAAAPPRGANGPAGGGRRGGQPATAEEIAEMARLNDLPAYGAGLGDGDYSVGPNYRPAPEQTAREGVPRGKVINFTMASADSKFYPGNNGGFQRAVTVYVPAQYVPGTPAPVIVSCDAYRAQNRQLPNMLDNLIAAKRLPVMVAVMVMPGGPERSLEYDTVSGKYAEFVEAEVLPRAEKEAGVTITKDPDARMTLGGSSGGAASFTMAWFHPEWYHRVVSYSGSFTQLQRGPAAPHGAWEFHENLIPQNPAKPLRVWLHVSEHDIGATNSAAGFRNWVIANEHMAAALKDKGYHYQLVYAKNAGHVDGKVIAQTLPQALEYAWQGYPISPAK
jgi:enterochelin esterase-like enzyme